jgi:hypothetical protein
VREEAWERRSKRILLAEMQEDKKARIVGRNVCLIVETGLGLGHQRRGGSGRARSLMDGDMDALTSGLGLAMKILNC